jgi:hypothetical protein
MTKRRVLPSDVDDNMLDGALQVLFFGLAEAHMSAGISDLAEDAIERYFPGKVHDIAVALTWIPEPKAPKRGGVELGDLMVSEPYRHDFLQRLSFALSSLRAFQTETPAIEPVEWEEPTPASILRRFQDDTKLTNADIVRKMNQLRYTCDTKTFLRIKHPPKALRATRIETVLKLHAVIVSESPELFKDLNYRHLFWRRKA